MTRQITFKGSQVSFPAACVVCQGRPDREYKISRSFTTGARSSVVITLKAPFCSKHYSLAMEKNQKEKNVERVGLVAAIVLGALTWLWFFLFWTGAYRGGVIDVISALMFGVVALAPGGFVFLIIRAIGNRIAANFADPEAKISRGAVKITNYRPYQDEMTLEFANDQVADIIYQLNGGQELAKNR